MVSFFTSRFNKRGDFVENSNKAQDVDLGYSAYNKDADDNFSYMSEDVMRNFTQEDVNQLNDAEYEHYLNFVSRIVDDEKIDVDTTEHEEDHGLVSRITDRFIDKEKLSNTIKNMDESIMNSGSQKKVFGIILGGLFLFIVFILLLVFIFR